MKDQTETERMDDECNDENGTSQVNAICESETENKTHVVAVE